MGKTLRVLRRAIGRGWICWLVVTAAPAYTEPVRLAMEIFGSEAQVEVRGLPRAQAETIARQALLEVSAVANLTDPASVIHGGVGDVERSAAAGKTTGAVVDPRTFSLLRRGMQFCLWSNGAFGPLGGSVYRLWRDGLPNSLELRGALENANCSLLQLATDGPADPTPQAAIPATSAFELTGMSVGFAVDRAVQVMVEAGAFNVFVEIGDVMRGVGGGPSGEGWPVQIPGVAGTRHPLEEVLLRDQSLAFLYATGQPGDARRIDLRTGVPSRGVVLIAAVSELAIDTEALASTLFVVGHNQGQLLLGQLDPRPSILWLLGEKRGTPLESRYHWASLARR